MLNRNSARAGLIEVHVDQARVPNASGKSACLSVSREIAGQRIVHEPRAGAQSYVTRRVSSLAACFEPFGNRRHRCRCQRNSQDYQPGRKCNQRFSNDSEPRFFHRFALSSVVVRQQSHLEVWGWRTGFENVVSRSTRAAIHLLFWDWSSPVALCRWGGRVIGSYCLV